MNTPEDLPRDQELRLTDSIKYHTKEIDKSRRNTLDSLRSGVVGGALLAAGIMAEGIAYADDNKSTVAIVGAISIVLGGALVWDAEDGVRKELTQTVEHATAVANQQRELSELDS